jgi:hypothetical protein
MNSKEKQLEFYKIRVVRIEVATRNLTRDSSLSFGQPRLSRVGPIRSLPSIQMEVHAPKVASRIGIPCSSLISLLNKLEDIVPMGIKGSHEGVY